MDTQFQTSFIPKKPIFADQNVVKRHSGGTSVFMFIAMIIFVLSLAAAGFTFVFKQVLLKTQDSYRVDLKKKEASFNEPLIAQLKKANTKIDLANQLLKKHTAVSEVFDIVGQLTIQGVRFTNFEFSAADASPSQGSNSAPSGPKVVMKGVGTNFSSIAYQSDVFGQSEKFGTKKSLRTPILSDLSLDASGRVGFTFTAYLNSGDITYEQTLSSNNQ